MGRMAILAPGGGPDTGMRRDGGGEALGHFRTKTGAEADDADEPATGAAESSTLLS